MEHQADRLWAQWHALHAIYEAYARQVNLTHSQLYILELLTKQEDCTQKELCEALLLPKQRVNAIITGFQAKGLVTLEPLPQDRRTKVIRLTQAGLAYALPLVEKMQKAEGQATQAMTPEELDQLTRLLGKYTETLSAHLP